MPPPLPQANKQPLPLPITYTKVATEYVLNSVSPNLTAGTLIASVSLFDAGGLLVKSVSVSVPFSANDTIASKLNAIISAIPTA